MKKYSLLICVSLIVLFFTGCTKTAGLYKNGTYTGEGEGKNGLIKVEVIVKDEKISELKTVQHEETPGLSDPVFEKIYASIIEEQTAEVDVVSGGTYTSDGIKFAVNDALEKAKK